MADAYATYGQTESGDDLPILLWEVRPTDKMVDSAYQAIMPEEYEEVGFTNWTCQEVEYPKSVQQDLKLLNHLEAMGVDNWEGYSWPDDEEDEDE